MAINSLHIRFKIKRKRATGCYDTILYCCRVLESSGVAEINLVLCKMSIKAQLIVIIIIIIIITIMWSRFFKYKSGLTNSMRLVWELFRCTVESYPLVLKISVRPPTAWKLSLVLCFVPLKSFCTFATLLCCIKFHIIPSTPHFQSAFFIWKFPIWFLYFFSYLVDQNTLM
jgi:hypothetical protein